MPDADDRAERTAEPNDPQGKSDFREWFRKHQTAVLIVGVVGVVLTGVVLFRSNQSQANSGAAGVAPAATVDASTSQAIDSMTQALQNVLAQLSSGAGNGNMPPPTPTPPHPGWIYSPANGGGWTPPPLPGQYHFSVNPNQRPNRLPGPLGNPSTWHFPTPFGNHPVSFPNAGPPVPPVPPTPTKQPDWRFIHLPPGTGDGHVGQPSPPGPGIIVPPAPSQPSATGLTWQLGGAPSVHTRIEGVIQGGS